MDNTGNWVMTSRERVSLQDWIHDLFVWRVSVFCENYRRQCQARP